MKAFRLFDDDNTGKISFKNLKRVAKELGENMTDEELQEMIDEADRDGDGEINEEDFLRIMKKVYPCFISHRIFSHLFYIDLSLLDYPLHSFTSSHLACYFSYLSLRNLILIVLFNLNSCLLKIHSCITKFSFVKDKRMRFETGNAGKIIIADYKV